MQYTQLKSKDISIVREELLEKQNGVCDLCKEKILPDSGASLDHQHKNKSDEIGADGGGLIRGVLCRDCNVTEGRIWNSMKRHLQTSLVEDRIQWLESLIEYYKKPNLNMIHPSEEKKLPPVSKSNYNKLKKLYNLDNRKAKFPPYPKSKKLTKKLEKLFKEYNIPPYN